MFCKKIAVPLREKFLIYVCFSKSSFDGFYDWLMEFRASFGIPNTLMEIGIDASESKKIGEMAKNDPSAQGNPISFTAKQYSEIFESAVKGDAL